MLVTLSSARCAFLHSALTRESGLFLRLDSERPLCMARAVQLCFIVSLHLVCFSDAELNMLS